MARTWQDLDKASKELAIDLGKGTMASNTGNPFDFNMHFTTDDYSCDACTSKTVNMDSMKFDLLPKIVTVVIVTVVTVVTENCQRSSDFEHSFSIKKERYLHFEVIDLQRKMPLQGLYSSEDCIFFISLTFDVIPLNVNADM